MAERPERLSGIAKAGLLSHFYIKPQKMKRFPVAGAVVLLLLAASGLKAQLSFRQYWLAGGSMFVSGIIDGTLESITWHYEEGFKPRFPKANDQYWNPARSWKNKYRNHDPAQGPKFSGSTNIFVFTTDAYHMLRTANRTIDGVTLASYVNECRRDNVMERRKKWLRVAGDFLIFSALRTAGFHLTYSVLFRKQ